MHQRSAATLSDYLAELMSALRAFQADGSGPLEIQVQTTDLDEKTLAQLR